jgi:hypothetical protein
MDHRTRWTVAGVSIVMCCAIVGAGLPAGMRFATNRAQLEVQASAASGATTPQVPDQYRDLYNGLKAQLDAANAQLNKLDHGQTYPITFGAELQTANSNLGARLIDSRMTPVNNQYLDGLKRLGVQGVTIDVAYPVFTPNYPDYSKYLSYYKDVVAQIRKRGMKLDVEAHVIFTNTPFSSIKVDYSHMTFTQYESALHQMDQTIIDQLHPDYMSILSEPDTMAQLTPYTQLKDPAQATQFVQTLLKGLKRGKTKVGAGTGTWSPPTYATDIATQTSVDYISIHIYPVNQTVMSNTLAMINVAKKNHKRVVLDEAWLYKNLPGSTISATVQGQTSVAAAPSIYRLDNYSFWQPLDQEFLSMVVKLARVEGIDYISPFWSGFFFSYVDYDSNTSNLPYRTLSSTNTRATLQNLNGHKVSPTGTYYHQLIIKNTPKQKGH